MALLDEWSFNNRIRSRGDAIRRLCRMAIVADDDWPVMWRRILSISEMGGRAIDLLIQENPDQSWLLRVKANLLDLKMDALELNAQLTQLKEGDTAEKAFVTARLAREQLRSELLDENALYAIEFPDEDDEAESKD
ncbi:hypothetical protein [Pararhizobium gei]|uniref:hypothetical protein n=1 Tax=Pararhizobium gei TaxID=1395951 RepID=UPI0023DC310C|nr:hypothetical protein [Rhizobium gei]